MKRDPLAFPIRPENAKRRDPNMHEKLASALLELAALRGDPIPWEHAAAMDEYQLCSLFEFDHARRYAQGGGTHPLNLTARFPGPHQEKTAKIDVPQIRKGIRLAAAHDAGIARMRAKILGEPTPKPKRKPKWNSPPLKGRSSWPKKDAAARKKS